MRTSPCGRWTISCNGHGLTWNAGERVQSYTHPLWMLLLTGVYFVTREAYYSTLLLSAAVSILAVVLLLRYVATSSPWSVLVGGAALVLSKAFVDYSTSGLENPLTHLLLALFFIVYLRTFPAPRKLFLLSLIAALIAVNRVDAVLLVGLPFLLALVEERAYVHAHPLAALGWLALGALPFVAWEIFSLAYYGFLVPNTAFAKLNTGIPQADLLRQGLVYLVQSTRIDYFTSACLLGFAVLALLARRARITAMVLAALLYLAYVVWIGGDFMSGRFLAAPFFCIVAAATASGMLDGRRIGPAVLAAVLVLGLLQPTVARLGRPHLPVRRGRQPHDRHRRRARLLLRLHRAGAPAAGPGRHAPPLLAGRRTARPLRPAQGAAGVGRRVLRLRGGAGDVRRRPERAGRPASRPPAGPAREKVAHRPFRAPAARGLPGNAGFGREQAVRPRGGRVLRPAVDRRARAALDRGALAGDLEDEHGAVRRPVGGLRRRPARTPLARAAPARRLSTELCNAQGTADVRFAGGPKLVGYSAEVQGAGADRKLAATLYWQRGDEHADYLASFVHVRPVKPGQPANPNDPYGIWAGAEHYQPGGHWSTEYWRDHVYVDQFLVPLPPDMPAGEYGLEVGWFDPKAGEQLDPVAETVKPPLGILWRSVLLPPLRVDK